MEILISFITFLFYIFAGFIALDVVLLLMLVILVYTFKAGRMLFALLNTAITEPETKIVSRVRQLSKKR